MGLKKYFFFSLLLIIVIAGYVFSINANDYRIAFFDYGIVLPIAIWVVIPVVALFLLSFLHMIFYGMKGYFEKNAFKKDFDNIIHLLKARIEKQEYNHAFKTTEAKEVSSTISQLDVAPQNSDFSTTNKEIQDIVSKINKINSGEYVPTKELKLPSTNPIMELNFLNKLKIDSDFALEVIKKSTNYTQKTVDAAIQSLIKNKSLTTIRKNFDTIKFNKELAFELFEKDSEKKESFSLSRDEIIKIVSPLEFSKSEYLKLAKIYKKSFSPEEIIKLFEDLSTKNEEANYAYLYILFEYEMLDNIREILQNSANNEYLPFKALLDLKGAGKHYRLDSLCLN